MAKLVKKNVSKAFDSALVELTYTECLALNYVLRKVGGDGELRDACDRVMLMLQDNLGMPNAVECTGSPAVGSITI